MRFVLALITMVLAGCSTVPDTQVVIQKEYVVRTAPAQLKQLPTYPKNLDVKTANQVDLADWLAANEQHTYELEAIIAALIKFYEKPVESK